MLYGQRDGYDEERTGEGTSDRMLYCHPTGSVSTHSVAKEYDEEESDDGRGMACSPAFNKNDDSRFHFTVHTKRKPNE